MFFGGGRDDDDNNNPLAFVFMIVGIHPVDLRSDHRYVMQSAVSRRREFLADASGVQAHPLSARTDLGPREAERVTPR
jgi:hypothetical protein